MMAGTMVSIRTQTSPTLWHEFTKLVRIGGYLGYNCSHVYPHTNRTKLNFLAPDNLKGADMVMFETFRSLGLKVSFRPAATDLHYFDDEGYAQPIVGLKLDWVEWGNCSDENLEGMYGGWTGEWPGYFDNSSRRVNKQPVPDYVRFADVHWLNDFGHKEPQISWIAVSGLTASQLPALSTMSHTGVG
jgi:hypothetical protein